MITDSITSSIVADFQKELINAKQSNKDLVTIVLSDKYDKYYKSAIDEFLKETNYPFAHKHSDYDRTNKYNIILLDNFKNKVNLFGEDFDRTLSGETALYSYKVTTSKYKSAGWFNVTFVIMTGKVPNDFFNVEASSNPSDKNLSLDQYEEVIVSIHCNCENEVFEEYNKYRLDNSAIFRLYKIPVNELNGLFETFHDFVKSNGWTERVFDDIIYTARKEDTVFLNSRNLEFELALQK